MVMSVSVSFFKRQHQHQLTKYDLHNTEKAYHDDFNVNVYPHHFALLAMEKFYEMHKARYPGVDKKRTEHIIGGKACKTQAYNGIEGHQSAVDETREEDFYLGSSGDEQTKAKKAKMNGDSMFALASDNREENYFDYEEDLSEMIQIAEDLLPSVDMERANVDACREM